MEPLTTTGRRASSRHGRPPERFPNEDSGTESEEEDDSDSQALVPNNKSHPEANSKKEALDALMSLGDKAIRKTYVPHSRVSPTADGASDSDRPKKRLGRTSPHKKNTMSAPAESNHINRHQSLLRTSPEFPVGNNRRAGDCDKGRVPPLLADPDEIVTEEMVDRYVGLYIEATYLTVNGVSKPMHSCKLCPGKSFSRRGHAVVHMRSHCGAKLHLCPWRNCRGRFGQVFIYLWLEER